MELYGILFKAGKFGKGGSILFIHTGGLFGSFPKWEALIGREK